MVEFTNPVDLREGFNHLVVTQKLSKKTQTIWQAAKKVATAHMEQSYMKDNALIALNVRANGEGRVFLQESRSLRSVIPAHVLMDNGNVLKLVVELDVPPLEIHIIKLLMGKG